MALTILKRTRSRALGFLGRRLSTCKDITVLIGRSMDEGLTLRERTRVRLHLLTCRACRNYLSNLKVMRDVLREPLLSPTTASGEGLSREAKERISRLIEDSKTE